MVRAGEISHGEWIADNAELIWNWASPAGELRAERRARLIAEAARLGPGTLALELGCGTGLFTRSFAQWGGRIVAVDVSPALLERARARQPSGCVTFRLEDAERLSLDDQSFDAVIGSSVLHHLHVDLAMPEIHEPADRPRTNSARDSAPVAAKPGRDCVLPVEARGPDSCIGL
jgi:SAM-dependent methyltransferase